MRLGHKWVFALVGAATGLSLILGVGNPADNVALANTPGAIDATFSTNFGSQTTNRTYAVAAQADGSVVFTGDFAGKVKRVSAAGLEDPTFNSNAASGATVNSGQAIAIDSAGRIVVGDNAGGPLNRFLATGAVDTAFNSASASALGTSGTGNAVAIYTSDSVLVGGTFSGGLKKVTSTGQADASFNTNAANSVAATVNAIAVQPDGKILVGGTFTGKIKRLNSDGTADATFNANASALVTSNVNAIALASDGSIVVGGSSSPFIRRLTSNGTAGSAFASLPTSAVNAVAIQSDGKVLAGGGFTGRLWRYNSNGTLDSTFAVTTADLNSTVNSVAVKSDGKIVLGLEGAISVKQFFGSYAAPNAPLAPTAVAGDRQASVTVRAGAGLTPTGYTVISVQDATKTCTVTGSSGTCVVSGLTNGSAYTFTAKAFISTSPMSASSPASNSVIPDPTPTLTSAKYDVTSGKVILTFSQPLAWLTTQSSRLQLMSGTTNVGITTISIAGSKVILDPSTIIPDGQTLTISYVAPASDSTTSNAAIQDVSGYDALSFNSYEVSRPFACTTDLYQSMGTTTQTTLRRFNPASGSYIDVGVPYSGYNSLAYNPIDDQMYAISSARNLLKISSDGSVQDLGAVGLTSLTAPAVYNVGYFLEPNIMVVAFNDAYWHRVDIISRTSTPITLSGFVSAAVGDIRAGDTVAVGGNLYYLTTDSSKLITIAVNSTSNWTVTTKMVSGIPTGSGTALDTRAVWGAAFTNAAGELFFALNRSGNLYQILDFNTASPRAILSATGDGLLIENNDGASCPLVTLAVAQVPPTVNPDASSGIQNTVQTKSILANDLAMSGETLDQTSVRLCGPNDISPNCSLTTLAVANEGTYQVDASSGIISFTPLSTFTGTATPVTYSVADSLLQFGASTYTPTVIGLPVLVADTSTGPYGQAQTIGSPLANDRADASSSLDSSTLRYCLPSETPNSCTKSSGTVTTVDGVYTINGDGTLTFMPATGFTGTVTQPLKYQIADTIGNVANSTVTPTVAPPPLPSASPQTKLVLPSSVVNFSTLTGPTGLAQPSAPGAPAITSVCLLIQPANTTCQTTVSGVQTITTADGTYRLTVATGVVAYTASASTTAGSKIPVTYRATDAVGNTVTNTLTPITPAAPVLSPDADSTGWDTTKSVSVLANDAADSANGLTLAPSTLKLCVSSATTCTTTTLAVANQGTYTANSDGTVSFDPVPGFSGVATPIRYFVADNLGQIRYSTLTMTVAAPNNPVASPDTETVIPGGTATFTALKGATGLAQPQTVGDPAISTVCLVGTVSSSTTCDADGVILVAGEGTYTLNATTGVVTFVAQAGITPGTKTPMYFKATDTAGNTVKSTLTPIVPAPPTLVADTSSVGWDVTSTVTVLANDTVAAGGTLDPSKVKLCISGNTPPACTGTTLAVTNQGTYTVNANGTITFDPLPTFSGTATPVTYSDTDSFGQTRHTTLTMTVATPANPVASPSTKTVLAGTSVTFPGITGSTGLAQPSTAGNPSITSVCLLIQPANTTCQTTVVSGASQTQTITTAAGIYVLNVVTGEVVYTANANASVGNQPAITYKVTDAAGHTATSTLTPVVPSPPTSVADTNTGNWDIIQTINVLGNDTVSGSATLNPTSVKLCAAGDVAPNCTLTTLTVADQGTYTVNADGTISFDPLPTFNGTATPVRYSVTDSLGLKSSATLTPTVLVPAGPTVLPDTQSVLANTTGPVNSVSFDPILGAGGLATPGASAITGVCLIDPATSNCAVTASNTQTVTTAQGTYVLNVTTGVTTFTPANNVTGTLNPITYKVTDVSGQSSTSTLTPIIPPLPTAVSDYSQGEVDQPQILSPLGNDTPGAASAPIVASALCLINPSTSVCAVTDSATQKQTITTANGTYVLDVPTGNVTFTPTAGFLGLAAPATYQITDSLGQKVTGTLNPKTLPAPAAIAVPDAPAGVNWSPTVTVVIDPLANDSAGTIPAGYTSTGTVALVQTSVKFCGPTESVPNCTLSSVTVANEGTYTINPTTGVITFDPVITFTGKVKVSPTYMVCNAVTGSWTDPQSNSIPTPPSTCATSTVTPTINPVAALVATPDTSTAEAGITQTKNLATNDTGVSGTATVKICGTNETSPNCTQTQVAVSGVGTYVVNGTTVTFIPLSNYTGTPAAMPYVITDELARSTASTYTPTVTPTAPPVASPESKRVLPGVTANFTTIAGAGGLAVAGARPLTPSLTCLVDGSNACVQALTTASGTWSVDPATSLVSFTATQGTAPGTLPSVTYKVFDSVGNTATSTLTPIIPQLPVSANDTSTGLVNTNQTISILANDTSRSATPIVITSIKLCDIGQTGSACIATSVTVVGEGTYSVNASGVVTFTPANNYIGTATPISYVATDTMGQISSAAIALTVTAPAPVANNNSNSAMQNVTQSLNITSNDTAASGFAIDPATARLCETVNSCTSTSMTTADGIFTLASNGTLSFVPTTDFVGTVAPISYKVSDTLGQVTAATVAITVTPAPAPTAVNDTSSAIANVVQTINILTGDLATAGYPIVTNAVKLCATTVADSLCSDLQVVVPEGTYAVNGSGVVSFTPNLNFIGTPTPIKYLVTDTYGSQDSALIQPVVTAPALPVVTDNTSVNFKNQVQSFNITNNDSAAPNFTLDLSTARLCETANSCTSTTLTVAGQGTYVLASNGDVVFTPVNNYVGTATPVKYQVRDSVNQAATALIRVTVTPTPIPVPVNDASTGPLNVPQVKSVLTNDSATPGYPIVVSTVALCAAGETAPNCTTTSVVIADEGAYTVDSAGVVTFTPELNYFGTPTPVRYVVTDTYGSKASALYAPVVVPPAAPVAEDNSSVGLINVEQNFNILDNDTATFGFSIDATTAALCQPGETGVACVSTTVTIAGEGTYVLSPNGDVVFTPVQDYIGTATPIRYVVKDNLGQLATAFIQVEVTPTPIPVAVDDSSSGYVNAVQTIRVLSNDSATSGYPIDITLVKLCGPGEVGPNCTATSVVITGEGAYAVDASGVVTFTPEQNFVGVPTPVGYVVTDSFGSKASAQIRPVVLALPVVQPSAPAPVIPEPVKPEPVAPEPVKPEPKPVAKPDQKSGKMNTPVKLMPVANDVKATMPLVATSIVLCTVGCEAVAEPANPAAPAAKPIVAKQGTWSVEPSTGAVTFTPVKSWFGRASIKYVVFDQAGNPVISTITVVIPKPKLPKTLVYTGDGVKVAPKAPVTKTSASKPKAFATMTAPRLGKNWSQKIFEGTSVAEVLNPLGLGHYEMTAMPGEIGNFAVAGHRVGSGGPFLNIDKFRAGDLVHVTTAAGKKFTYRYLQTKVVKPSEVGVVGPEPAGLTAKRSSDALLTLQTCTPVHVNTHRLIVWFELVD